MPDTLDELSAKVARRMKLPVVEGPEPYALPGQPRKTGYYLKGVGPDGVAYDWAPCPAYARDPAAADEVLRWIAASGRAPNLLWNPYDKSWCARIILSSGRFGAVEFAPDWPEALARAFLAATEGEGA